MKKALFTTALMAMLGVFAFSAIAAGNAEAAAEVSGHGKLYARGSGQATIEGDGRVLIKAGGPAQITVCGAEEIDARGSGTREESGDGCVKFSGWRGTIVASGEEMSVDARGIQLWISAQGEGVAFLKGRGAFHVGHVSGRWTPDGVRVHFQP